MRNFTMHRRTLSSGLLLFRSKGGKTEGAFHFYSLISGTNQDKLLQNWTFSDETRPIGRNGLVISLYSYNAIRWVIYLQFLESKGYYLTKNWFLSAYLGFLHQQTKQEFTLQNQRTNCVLTNFCLEIWNRFIFQNCQISSALDLLMRPAGIVCR